MGGICGSLTLVPIIKAGGPGDPGGSGVVATAGIHNAVTGRRPALAGSGASALEGVSLQSVPDHRLPQHER